MTIVGILVAALFFATSRAEPVDSLSRQRPPVSIFSVAVCLSVVLQAAIHLVAIVSVASLGIPLPIAVDEYTPDGPFRPNAFNGAIFLISSVQTVTTFVANYRGEPFMQSILEHKLLLYIALGAYGVLTLTALGLPVFTRLLEVPDFKLGSALEASVRFPLIIIMIADVLLCVGVEYGCRMLE
eukprot:scaffold447_cov307-Pinguiococcus_pyrenoidosus.AAC.83